MPNEIDLPEFDDIEREFDIPTPEVIVPEADLDVNAMETETVRIMSIAFTQQIQRVTEDHPYTPIAPLSEYDLNLSSPGAAGPSSSSSSHHQTRNHTTQTAPIQMPSSSSMGITVGGGGDTLDAVGPMGGTNYTGSSYNDMNKDRNYLKSTSMLEDSQCDIIASRLLTIADEVDRRYGNLLNSLAQQLLVSDFDMESFTRIARTVFERGITMGRIIILLCFGLKLAYALVSRHMPNAFHDFFRHLLSFMMNNGILSWLWSRYGGWNFISQIRMPNLSIQSLEGFALAAAIFALSTIVLNRYLQFY